jgi:glycosyltransferase involved in cell wall biosynthesis
VHRFIDRSTAEGSALFRELLSRSHFLLFFSKAEAYGLAPCEANAFGVPCLATAVGGIPTVVREGANGFLFPAPLDLVSCTKRVMELVADRQSYGALARSARAEFDTRLNWKVAGARLRELIEERAAASGSVSVSSRQMKPMPVV